MESMTYKRAINAHLNLYFSKTTFIHKLKYLQRIILKMEKEVTAPYAHLLLFLILLLTNFLSYYSFNLELLH